jgi:hypothetical protein
MASALKLSGGPPILSPAPLEASNRGSPQQQQRALPGSPARSSPTLFAESPPLKPSPRARRMAKPVQSQRSLMQSFDPIDERSTSGHDPSARHSQRAGPQPTHVQRRRRPAYVPIVALMGWVTVATLFGSAYYLGARSEEHIARGGRSPMVSSPLQLPQLLIPATCNH